MFEAIKKIFNGLNPFRAEKKEQPDFSDSKIIQTGQKALSIIPTETASANKIKAKPIKLEGWFSWVTSLFRKKLYQMFKGEPPSKPGEVKNLLTNMGGIENNLKTTNDVSVRTMHLKASQFLGKIKEAQGSRVEIKVDGKAISGFAFDKIPADLKTTLSKLGILDSCYTNAKGQVTQIDGIWAMHEINGKFYILAKNDVDFLIEKDALTQTGFSSGVALEKSPIEPLHGNNTTVVLGGGVCSYFESYRSAQEAAQFLIRGLDVVIFEDKNLPLESEADYNVMATREAIFKHLTDLGLRNEQIILKGLCFSSVPAVELAAAKGGNVPIIIDQGYTDIKPVAANGIANNAWSPLANMAKIVARPIIKTTFSDMDLNYKMRNLKNIHEKTPLCVIVNENDELVPQEERSKMDEILKGREFHRVAINNKAIRHAGPWYQDPAATKQIDNFLKQHFNNQTILGAS